MNLTFQRTSQWVGLGLGLAVLLGAWPASAGSAGELVNKKDGSALILIPAGSFTMGSDESGATRHQRRIPVTRAMDGKTLPRAVNGWFEAVRAPAFAGMTPRPTVLTV